MDTMDTIVDFITNAGYVGAFTLAGGVCAAVVWAWWEQVTWLASMLVRPVYLARLRAQGEQEWSLHRHGQRYAAAVQARFGRDDRQRLSERVNQAVDAALLMLDLRDLGMVPNVIPAI